MESTVSIVKKEKLHWSRIFESELKRNCVDAPAFSSYWWQEYYDEMVAHMRHLLPEQKDCKILEAGSGSGKASILLDKKYWLTLLDISPIALKYARVLAKKFNHPRVRYVEGDVFAMPFSNYSFDLVWNIGVIEHYDEDLSIRIMREMIRVTKHDGRIAIGVPNFYSGPIVKARVLRWPLFNFLPGYRLDSEQRYTATMLKKLLISAIKKEKREVKDVQVAFFGNALPMETPELILRSLGKMWTKVLPRTKFLIFVTVRVE